MKTLLIVLLFTALLFPSCAFVASPLPGFWYTDVRYPMAELDATDKANSSKSGESQATSILGLVATGDASIQAAAKAGGITKIHHVDYEATSFLGLFASLKTIVYGE